MVLKIILFALAGVVILVVLFLAFIFWNGKQQADDVKAMCATKLGTPIEEVVKRAHELDFMKEANNKLSAIGDAFTIKGVINGEEKFINSEGVMPDDLNDGVIILGKTVLFPFLRHYCHIYFENRKVTQTKSSALD